MVEDLFVQFKIRADLIANLLEHFRVVKGSIRYCHLNFPNLKGLFEWFHNVVKELAETISGQHTGFKFEPLTVLLVITEL